jgi:methionyl aminopeptidase
MPGDRIGKISSRVEKHVKQFNYGIVRELVGHGVGKELHEDPQIPNYGSENSGEVIPPNCTLAIEPMINLGTHKILLLSDDWTIITRDRQPSAHYENTILVTDNGVEILTLMEGETRNDEV